MSQSKFSEDIYQKCCEDGRVPRVLNSNFIFKQDHAAISLGSQLMELNINGHRLKIKIPNGISSSSQRLRVLLIGNLEFMDCETKECLAVCYSSPFDINSHSSQLTEEEKKLRKALSTPGKKYKKTPIPWSVIQEAYEEMSQISKFFITNVGAKQVQDRGLMGAQKLSDLDGRYPCVCVDINYFMERFQPCVKVRGLSLQFDLVTPLDVQRDKMMPI